MCAKTTGFFFVLKPQTKQRNIIDEVVTKLVEELEGSTASEDVSKPTNGNVDEDSILTSFDSEDAGSSSVVPDALI